MRAGEREETLESVWNIKVTQVISSQVISSVAWLVSKCLSAALRTWGALSISQGQNLGANAIACRRFFSPNNS